MEYEFDDIKVDIKKIDDAVNRLAAPFIKKIADEVIAPFCKKWDATYRSCFGTYFLEFKEGEDGDANIIMSFVSPPSKLQHFPKQLVMEAMKIRKIIELEVVGLPIFSYIESVRF